MGRHFLTPSRWCQCHALLYSCIIALNILFRPKRLTCMPPGKSKQVCLCKQPFLWLFTAEIPRVLTTICYLWNRFYQRFLTVLVKWRHVDHSPEPCPLWSSPVCWSNGARWRQELQTPVSGWHLLTARCKMYTHTWIKPQLLELGKPGPGEYLVLLIDRCSKIVILA